MLNSCKAPSFTIFLWSTIMTSGMLTDPVWMLHKGSCNPQLFSVASKKTEGLQVLIIQTLSPVSAGAWSRNAVLAKKGRSITSQPERVRGEHICLARQANATVIITSTHSTSSQRQERGSRACTECISKNNSNRGNRSVNDYHVSYSH